MSLVREILSTALFLYFLLLIGRLVFEWIQRPRGPVLVVAEGIYTATDPPLKALRRVLPTLRFGNVGIDLSFLVLMIGISVLMSIL